jgi:hypothetical protein
LSFCKDRFRIRLICWGVDKFQSYIFYAQIRNWILYTHDSRETSMWDNILFSWIQANLGCSGHFPWSQTIRIFHTGLNCSVGSFHLRLLQGLNEPVCRIRFSSIRLIHEAHTKTTLMFI